MCPSVSRKCPRISETPTCDLGPFQPCKMYLCECFYDTKKLTIVITEPTQVAPTKRTEDARMANLWAGQSVTINVKTARCLLRVRFMTRCAFVEAILSPHPPA